MTDEPDIFDIEPPKELDFSEAKADLETLAEKEFEQKYKSTKRLYRALISAIEILHETEAALKEPSPIEFEPDIIDQTGFLVTDYLDLLEQMHMASYWEREME